MIKTKQNKYLEKKEIALKIPWMIKWGNLNKV